MAHGWSRAVAGAAFMALVFLWTPAAAEDLVVPGSGNADHALSLLVDAFNRNQQSHRVVLSPTSGSAAAIRDVESGVAVLGRVGRPLTDAERARGLVFVPIARDPVLLVGGTDVTARALTTQQVLAIYTGQVTHWQQIGGSHGPIRAIGREPSDASRRALGRAIAPFETIRFDDRVKIVQLDSQMIDLLDRYPTSLGFLNRSALNAARTRLVELSLEGAAATADAVQAGRHDLWVEVGLIHKAGRVTPAARAFMNFVRSTDGESVLSSQGMILASHGQGMTR